MMIIVIIIIMITKTYNNDDNDNDNNNFQLLLSNNNNASDNDENDDDNDNKLPVDSQHKGSIMLSFDDTFVESKNNSRDSGDLRCHVPHVTSLWCDIFAQHRHICIVESSYE